MAHKRIYSDDERVLRNRASRARYRERNRATLFNKKKETCKQLKQKICEYLSLHHCVDCGESDIVVLHFDHIIGKKKATIYHMISCGGSWAGMQSEIKKCAVRCANCHTRRHAKERKTYRWRFQLTKR